MPRNSDFASLVNKNIGARIQELRIGSGWSRKKLCSEIGVTHQQLQKYEKGSNRVTCDRLIQIAQALGRPSKFFFEGIEDYSPLPTNHQRMCIEVSRNFLKVKNPIHQNAINSFVKALAE